MKKAILLTLTSTALTALYLAFYGGIAVSLLLALSLLLSILYTGGPYPLAYLGLGDLFVFVFFGPIAATGTFFVQTGFFSWDAVLIGCAAGAIATAILATNNLRDIEEDAVASKKTLAVRFGKSFTRIEYLSCLLIAALIPFYFMNSHPYCVLSLSFLPFAASSIKTVFSYKDPRELNTTLAKTGQLLLIYTLCFCIGWLI